MARRDEFGREHLQFSVVLATGTNNIAHGISDTYAEIDDYSAFVINTDGLIIKDNNPYNTANSDMVVKVNATNFTTDISGVSGSKLVGQTLHVYVIKRPNT